jgi:membrane protein
VGAQDDPRYTPRQNEPAFVVAVRRRLERSFVGLCVERVLELQPFDRSLALASRAFVALFPLAIVSTSLSPAARSGGFAQGLIDRFGLEGQGAELVRRLFATPDQVRGSVTILGLLVLVYSVFGFARLLTRLYEHAWRLPPAGARRMAHGLAWVAGAAAYIGFIAPLSTAIQHDAGPAVRHVLAFTIVTLWWLATPYVLLAGRIGYRRLLPTGIITAVAMGLAGIVSALYMPHEVTTLGARYGLVGVAFSLVSWLIGIALALLVSAAVGAVAAERWLPTHETASGRP